MLTKFAIQNFKGIRERVELEIKPITLLFGANSAGKSTILHALHYAREIFDQHNLDADQTISGGRYIDLGGFQSLVHNHDLDSPIRMWFLLELPTGEEGFDTYTVKELRRFPRSKRDRGALDTSTHIFEFDISVNWSESEERPYVSECKIKANGEVSAVLRSDPQGDRVSLELHWPIWTVNVWTFLGDVLDQVSDDYHEGSEEYERYADELQSESWWKEESVRFFTRCCQMNDDNTFLLSDGDALPDLRVPLPFAVRDEKEWPTSHEVDVDNIDAPTSGVFLESAWSRRNVVAEMTGGFSRMVQLPLRLVQESLTQLRYLGPLRETPPRNFSPPKYPDDARWSSGLGAWDTLHNGSEEFVDAVGDWLGNEDKLNSGYRLEQIHVKEIDCRELQKPEKEVVRIIERLPTITRLRLVSMQQNADSRQELEPHDIGIGISQVVPVVVTALDGKQQLLAIEQPELHLHPRFQAELADLFVETIKTNQHRFIIETHSEHLILRLLRRIRETESNKGSESRRLSANDLAIYYFKCENGVSSELRMDVDVHGEFIQPWPDDFFEVDFYERFS